MSRQDEILFWRGCTYRNQLPEELRSIEEVLHKLKIPFKTLEEECCGYPLFLSGYLKGIEELATEVSKAMGSFKLIVTACPACLKAFEEFYRERLHIELPRVLHLTQFLVEKEEEGVLTKDRLKPVNMKVMYHDPCELGRDRNVYEEPRRLLGLVPGLRLFEQRFTREASACCGGGGLLPAFSPTLASMAAARKLTQEDRVPEDLDAVVTTCPQCILNMRRGLEMWVEEESLEGLKVLGLAQILDKALGG
ncbi:MAG: (Fe-S)-binding protein [Candidatus Bathyarchaeia archaeon]